MSTENPKRGRPYNSFKYGESTVVARIPKSLKPKLAILIKEHLAEPPMGAIQPKFAGHRRPLSAYKIPAGFPSPAEGFRDRDLSFDELFDMQNPAVFLYKVDGHSLEGVGILDGNIVVVNRSLTPRNGEPIMGRVDGKDTFKLFYRGRDGSITLKASNDKISYPDILIREGTEFEFMGVIMGTVKTFRG